MRAIIFANGGFTQPPALYAEDLIIAADGGARHCMALGLTPQVVIGDFDSLSAEQVDDLQAAGVRLIRHPQRKDFTDLELALQYAGEHGAGEVLVLAALGGRWDQTLANVLLPAAKTNREMRIQLVDGLQEIHLVRGGEVLHIHGNPGDTLSLIPIGSDAWGITTFGLEYALQGESLDFGSTRGISNVLLGESAEVHLENGLLICVVIHEK